MDHVILTTGSWERYFDGAAWMQFHIEKACLRASITYHHVPYDGTHNKEDERCIAAVEVIIRRLLRG